MIRNSASLWRMHLTNYGHQVSMDERQVDDLKAGLEFGKALGLPLDLTFSAAQMSDLLICKSTVRYFEYLRLAVIAY